jgi:hypothetical protein
MEAGEIRWSDATIFLGAVLRRNYGRCWGKQADVTVRKMLSLPCFGDFF